MDDIETLARWLHDTWRRALPRPWAWGWDDLGGVQRDEYRLVARELLERPPAVLARRPDAVARVE